MKTKLPSIISLSCFTEAAKYLSFTRAAQELCITQSAVSLQIKKLEQQLGCVLFNRVKQRLHLTDAGKLYAREVVVILNQLEQATHNLHSQISGRLLLGFEDSLTTCWLIPKLHDFQQRYPDIQTEIMSDLNQLYEQQTGFDVGVLYGSGQWTGFSAQYLMAEEFVAVCSPSLKDKFGQIEHLSGVLNYPFLHHTAQPSSSDYWLKAAGFNQQQISALPGQRFEHFKSLVDAAKHGLGLSILPKYFVLEELDNATLVLAFEKSLISKDSYYVVTSELKKHDLKIQLFVQWLLSWKTAALPELESKPTPE